MTKDDMLLEALFLLREAAKLMELDYAVMPMKMRKLADEIDAVLEKEKSGE